MHAFQAILLLLITAGVGYIAYRLFHDGLRSEAAPEIAGPAADAGARSEGMDRYGRQLAVYREVVRVLTRIGQDGDITKHELIDFRAKTHEAGFLFDKDVAGYVDEIYQRAVKLAGTNRALKDARLSIGDERDAITLENSRQLIWLADQLSQLQKRFGRHLAEPDKPPPSGR